MPYIGAMKQFIAILICMGALAQPALSQSAETGENPEAEDGLSLVEEGLQLFLRGLLEEMEPTFDDLRQFTEDMGPALEELREMLGDMSDYEAPEVLENGDIIIRRKTPPETPLKDGEVEI